MVVLVASSIISGRLWADSSIREQQVSSAEILARVRVLHAELEALRWHMGRPRNDQPEIDVSAVAHREVYFQALAVYRNAERLCFEHTRKRGSTPAPPPGRIAAADVYQLVEAALDRIRQVNADLGVPQQQADAPLPQAATPTVLFQAVVQANRQLNMLLDTRVAPSDVYEQVTLGVGYAARLLEQFPQATTLPDTPEFEAGKQPSDVYLRLLSCLDRIKRIVDRSGLRMMELHADEAIAAEVEPSDVYHVASLLVAELAYIHSQVPDATPPREVYYSGRKFPSHVYQRAGLLERQLVELERWVRQRPDWLSEGGTSQ